MTLSRYLGLVPLVYKVGVPKFVPEFAPDNLSVFNGDDEIVGCAPKVLADRISIIGYGCDFRCGET